MLLFRSLTLGMLGACLYLLVSLGRSPHREIRYVAVQTPAPPCAAIVNVAHGVTPAQLPGVIRLAPGEHVVAVADREAHNDLEAGALITEFAPEPQSYLELAVRGADATTRRVLVLAH